MSATSAPAEPTRSAGPAGRVPWSVWNGTVARLTYRALLGRRRALFLVALPALLLVMCAVVRAVSGPDDQTASSLLTGFAIATMVPLIGVVAGTGAIATEIDDGSIVYLLAKPIRRSTVVFTKLWVAMGVSAFVAAIPTFFAGVILDGGSRHLAVAFGVASVAATVAYSAIFLLLGIVTRHSVIVGLVYALVWETLIAGLVPGAGVLSVRQWSMAVAVAVADGGSVSSEVGLRTGLLLLAAVTVAATWLSVSRLRSLKVMAEE